MSTPVDVVRELGGKGGGCGKFKFVVGNGWVRRGMDVVRQEGT